MRTPKPAGCSECPLCKTGVGFFRPDLSHLDQSKLKLVVRGEALGKDEADESSAFVGRAGWWIRHNIFGNCGLHDGEVLYDNTLRCFPPLVKTKTGHIKNEHYPVGETRATAEEICRQYDQFDQVRLDVPLLLVGSKSLHSYTGLEGISEYHGHIANVKGRLVGCTFHPSAVMRQPNYLPIAIRETSNLLSAARQPHLLDRPRVHKGYLPYREGRPCLVDLEWNPQTEKLSVVGIAYDGQDAYSTYDVETGLEVVRQHIKNGTLVIGHNFIKADLPKIGVDPLSYGPKHIIDTMDVAHLIHAHLAELQLLDLGSLTRFYFPTTDWKHEKSDLLLYNGYDCAYNFRLYEALQRDLSITGQRHLVEKQQRLARLTYEMHERGVHIDVEGLTEFHLKRKEQQKEIKANLPINPQSPKQIVEFAKGKHIYISDAQKTTLDKVYGRDPEFDRVIEFRQDTKSLKTWFPIHESKKGLLEGIDDTVYPQFHETGTAVARFSCSDPNFQNIPPNLRRFIVPRDPDLELNAFDGSQIENRCCGWLSHCTPMLEAFARGEDFHRLNAANIQSKLQRRIVTPEEITKQQRQQGKTVTHATSYCETPYNLARRLFGNTSRDSLRDAADLHGAFFAAYPEMASWQKAVGDQLERGDIRLVNPFGRVRFIYAQDYHERQKRGCHFLGCSTAADIVNARALMVYDELHSEIGDLALPILIVHDELVYELPKGEWGARLRARIKEILDSPIPEMNGFVIPFSQAVGMNYGKYSPTMNPGGIREL